jgi:bacteriocin-like protein
MKVLNKQELKKVYGGCNKETSEYGKPGTMFMAILKAMGALFKSNGSPL